MPTGCVDTLVRSGVGVPVGGHVSRPGVREAWKRFQPDSRLDLPPKSARTGRLPFGGGRPTSDLHILVPFFAKKQFISSSEASSADPSARGWRIQAHCTLVLVLVH